MIEPRETLERRLKAMEDTVSFAVHAVKAAKLLIDRTVPYEKRGERSVAMLYAMVEAVAKNDGMTGPAVALYAFKEGREEGAKIADEVSRQGGDEWAAGAAAVAEEIRRRK